jgi:hypothetical protein
VAAAITATVSKPARARVELVVFGRGTHSMYLEAPTAEPPECPGRSQEPALES